MPHEGLVLTSIESIPALEQAFRRTRGRLRYLKVVTGWGLPWTPETRAAAAALAPGGLVVRTVAGDPSALGGGHALPVAEEVEEELAPWIEAAAPGQPVSVELGNEELIRDQADEQAAWDSVWHLRRTIRRLRARWPHVQIVSPAHMLNHPVRLGDHADGVARWLAIAAEVYAGCDVLGLHAYTLEQAVRGIRQLRTIVSAHRPIWLTEFALNLPLSPADRARRYREILAVLPVEVALFYHLNALGGSDPVHHNPNYTLDAATLEALGAPSSAPAPRPLATLVIHDLRPRLRVVPSKARARRPGAPTSITLHWNGPAVKAFGDPAGELRQIEGPDLDRHIGHLTADSLQYHFCILSDGSIWQTRDLDLQAWHCASTAGNRDSLAIHFPLGEGQVPTVAQWAAFTHLAEALIAEFGMPGRQAARGHMEWSSTACPGPELMRRLRAWRAIQHLRVIAGVDFAAVREGRGTTFPIALGGRCTLPPGAEIVVDDVTDGWAHLADGRGFVHMSVLQEA